MTATKSSAKLTAEDKAVLKPLYTLRAKRQKEMEGMSSTEVYAYIHKFELEAQRMAGFNKKQAKTAAK
ncbi:MAG: hypothetical protein LBN21_05190 [Treponema sp.]|jgi:hypothetical protein|nr:hypothetical protein [Treponema sp.]